jgi:hypothetical protein
MTMIQKINTHGSPATSGPAMGVRMVLLPIDPTIDPELDPQNEQARAEASSIAALTDPNDRTGKNGGIVPARLIASTVIRKTGIVETATHQVSPVSAGMGSQ